jgi:subtilisin family serine protease
MKKRVFKYIVCFAIVALAVMLAASMLNLPKAYADSETPPSEFKPIVWKPEWVDQDNNKIADTLDQEIADRIANGTADEYVDVVVTLCSEPTLDDADAFVSAGGYVTTSAWTHATYGFGGSIPYNRIAGFIQRCTNVLLVEKDAPCQGNIYYAAKQIGARTYVWNTVGLQGDPLSSIAILDTGIDDSHVDFAPGYGAADFSKKIVGWNDQIGSTTTPVDDNGHGSHCAGLAAGNGFFSVDASGYATATWGANLGVISTAGTYFVSGMMVNRTGTITINVRWARSSTSASSLSALVLYYGDKTLTTGSWTNVGSVSTPSQNTWYTLTYNIASTPSGGYDMYHIALTLTRGTSGSLWVQFTMSWPFTPVEDGFSAWTGIAPQAKLVGVKVLDYSGSGSSTGLINGINWVINNRQTYHITVASMSLGFTSEVTAVNTAVVNLVNSGVTVVCAAGNSGSGTNYIYTPGSVDEVITVAATNAFDNIASYSSQGGKRSGKQTSKPDIAAPGGSFYAVPLFSADSNDQEAEKHWTTETWMNDAAPMQGTSMSTPVVAGAVNIIQQAMGGYSNWQWTRTQALQPKMILLMTATETYPNLREGGTTATSPTLNRGGKDVHEGYGRMNLDAAVDAILKTYEIGTTVTYTLGKPPTLTDISVLGQPLAWARNVQLVKGFRYTFTLNVPAGADFDLYLYNGTGTAYGEPVIVASSTTATTGGTEQITVTAPYTGTYYLVVKRATATTGGGTFTLTSSGPVLVTLNTPGLESASNVVHYIQNGVTKTGSISAYKFSDYVDVGTTLSIDNPIYVSTTERFYTTDPTSFQIQTSATFTVSYTRQFYLTLATNPSGITTPSGEDWYNAGTYAQISTLEYVYTASDIRYRFNGWTGEGITNPATSTTTVLMDKAKTVTANYVLQFYLKVISPYGTSSGEGWYDKGTIAYARLDTNIVTYDGTRHLFVKWAGDATGTNYAQSDPIHMDDPKTAIAEWKTQYYLTVVSPYDTPGGEGWYDEGDTAYAVLLTGLDYADGVAYGFVGWSGDASGWDLLSNPIIMDKPKTAIANWEASPAYGDVRTIGFWKHQVNVWYFTELTKTGMKIKGIGTAQIPKDVLISYLKFIDANSDYFRGRIVKDNNGDGTITNLEILENAYNIMQTPTGPDSMKMRAEQQLFAVWLNLARKVFLWNTRLDQSVEFIYQQYGLETIGEAIKYSEQELLNNGNFEAVKDICDSINNNFGIIWGT